MPMKKAEMQRRSREAYVKKNPERYAAWHQAMEHPEACVWCGKEGRPRLVQHEGVWAVIGWECYPCRTVQYGQTQKPPPPK